MDFSGDNLCGFSLSIISDEGDLSLVFPGENSCGLLTVWSVAPAGDLGLSDLCLLEVGRECSVDSAVDLGWWGDGGCLLGGLVVFDMDLVFLEGGGVVFAGYGRLLEVDLVVDLV